MSVLTDEQIKMVQKTWQSVLPIAEQAASLFYGRLFELDPSLKSLFKGDMAQQGKKLMDSIHVAVVQLHSLGEVVPAVQALGRRHVDYGVTPEMYDTVGAALLWTLSKGLGDAFTDEVKEAWTITYQTLAHTMIEAAEAG